MVMMRLTERSLSVLIDRFNRNDNLRLRKHDFGPHSWTPMGWLLCRRETARGNS
jgi:hypothetical protein